MVCPSPERTCLEPYATISLSAWWAADAGYEDFIASINEPLTFLSLKIKRTKYNVS